MSGTAPPPPPSWRKPAGILAILAYVGVWTVIVTSLWPWLSTLPVLAQAPVYLIAGVIWIAPLGPWLRWIETGKFR